MELKIELTEDTEMEEINKCIWALEQLKKIKVEKKLREGYNNDYYPN
jgi:hypothetical protein